MRPKRQHRPPTAEQRRELDRLIAMDPMTAPATLALKLDPRGTGRPTGAQVAQWLEPYGLAAGAHFTVRLSLAGGGASGQ